jgi:hypothetical protein
MTPQESPQVSRWQTAFGPEWTKVAMKISQGEGCGMEGQRQHGLFLFPLFLLYYNVKGKGGQPERQRHLSH